MASMAVMRLAWICEQAKVKDAVVVSGCSGG